MRYDKIDSKLFIENRKRFCAEMKPNSVAIFFSNDLMPRSADSFHTFRQNPDLFHLSGIDQEDSILILFPDCPNEDFRECLFLKETNEHIAIWEGAKLSKPQARDVSGILNVYWSDKWEGFLPVIMNMAQNVYLNLTEHDRFISDADYADRRWARILMNKYPLHNYERSAPIMHRLRSIKSKIEIDLIQKACDITEKGVRRLLKFIKPGVWEYQIEAELTHEFLNNRSTGHAYYPIIASGESACVLHYVENNKQCKDGDVILLDFGAEYANYASDLTRCLPVNGKFSKRQKDVYNATLRVFRGASAMLTAGNRIKEYHDAVGLLMEKELVDLGLLTVSDIKKQDPTWPAYKKYFMHGTSHYLGLDVHDSGSRWQKMEAGMVFTCEPGIYIPEEGLGIRIENDFLVTKGAPKDLMANIPIEAEEIEMLMKN